MSVAGVQEIQAELVSVRQELRRLTEVVSKVIVPERPIFHTRHPYIVRIEGVCGGWPVIRGTRLTVQAIVEKIRQGQTPGEIVAGYPERLTLAHVHDALSYYYENPEEIEAQITANRSALERVPQLRALHTEGRAQT